MFASLDTSRHWKLVVRHSHPLSVRSYGTGWDLPGRDAGHGVTWKYSFPASISFVSACRDDSLPTIFATSCLCTPSPRARSSMVQGRRRSISKTCSSEMP